MHAGVQDHLHSQKKAKNWLAVKTKHYVGPSKTLTEEVKKEQREQRNARHADAHHVWRKNMKNLLHHSRGLQKTQHDILTLSQRGEHQKNARQTPRKEQKAVNRKEKNTSRHREKRTYMDLHRLRQVHDQKLR